VRNDLAEASEVGVTGVPFFVIDRKYAISGAQSETAISQTVDKAYTEWEKNNPAPKLKITEGQSCTIDGECH
jgi:protein disulfide-isomerase